MKWRIGKVTVSKIVELEVTGGSRFILPQATYEEILPIEWLRPHFADERGRLKMSIHALVVETPDRRIIVDTCLGNDKQGRRIPTWNNLQGPFLADLAAAGFPRESIDTVLCTHLHVDHGTLDAQPSQVRSPEWALDGRQRPRRGTPHPRAHAGRAQRPAGAGHRHAFRRHHRRPYHARRRRLPPRGLIHDEAVRKKKTLLTRRTQRLRKGREGAVPARSAINPTACAVTELFVGRYAPEEFPSAASAYPLRPLR